MISKKRAEKRKQPRVCLAVPIRATVAEGVEPISATTADLSWGGASFLTKDLIIDKGDVVRLEFPWSRGKHFVVDGVVLRAQLTTDGNLSVAVRFADVPLESQRRLNKLLGFLFDKREGKEIQLAQQMEILCNDKDEMLKMLQELAKGGIWVTAFQSYDADERLELAIAGLHDERALKLRTRVERVVADEAVESHSAHLYQVYLHFEHPIEELKKLAWKLYRRMSAKRRSDQEEEESQTLLPMTEELHPKDPNENLTLEEWSEEAGLTEHIKGKLELL